AIKMPMIAITTSNSISVNASGRRRCAAMSPPHRKKRASERWILLRPLRHFDGKVVVADLEFRLDRRAIARIVKTPWLGIRDDVDRRNYDAIFSRSWQRRFVAPFGIQFSGDRLAGVRTTLNRPGTEQNQAGHRLT